MGSTAWGIESACCVASDRERGKSAKPTRIRLVTRLLSITNMKLAALLVVLWPLAARAEGFCRDVHAMRSIDPAFRPGDCTAITLRHPIAIGDPVHPTEQLTVTVMHAGRSTATTGEETPAIDEIRETFQKAFVAAGRILIPLGQTTLPEDPHHPKPAMKITVYLDPNPTPTPENRVAWANEFAAARAAHVLDEDDCLIAFHYKSDPARRKFDAAHQLFHCITVRAWPEAHLATTDSDWWAEGGAEMFANIVFPDIGTAGDAATFRAHESLSLFRRAADAVVFFEWYATGAGKLKGLIDIVQDKPAQAMSVDLLEEIGGNHWLELEEAYYDHTIVGPSGPVYASTPAATPVQRVASSTTKDFTAVPYEIHGATLVFAQGKSYDLDAGPDTDFHWKWSEGDGGGWEAPPTTVHTCHEDKRYRIVVAGKLDVVHKHLRITARDEREADCPCVVGAWQQTAASLARVAQRLQARGIRNASCTIDGGGTTISFTADHNGGETYNGMHTSCTSPTSRSEGTTNGTRAFTWTDTSATQMTFASAGGNASSHITVTTHGHSSQMDAPLTGQGNGAVTYRCSRTDLHLEYGTEAFDYTRVGSGSGSGH